MNFPESIQLFHNWRVGPPHFGIQSIKPANRLPKTFISYRLYMIKRNSNIRKSNGTIEMHTYLKNLSLKMNWYFFDWTDLIVCFYFITRFVSEADMISMAEAQAFIVL